MRAVDIARTLIFRACVGMLLALAILGHVIVLLLGALDALLAAFFGVPRLSHGTRQFVQVVRETWQGDQ
jgi:Na+-driven multidrug efflux pump